MNLDRRLISFMRPLSGLFITTISQGLISGVLVIFQAWLLSRIITSVFLGNIGLHGVQEWIFQLLIVALGRGIAGYIGETSAKRLAIKIKTTLRTMLLEHLFSTGPATLSNENSGEITSTLVQGVELLDDYFSQYLPQAVIAALLPLLILIVVFPLDLLSGAILLITAPLIPVFMVLIGKGTEAATRRQFQALSRLSVHFLDTLKGLSELKRLSQNKKQEQRIKKSSEGYRTATMGVLRIAFLSALVLELVGTISTAVIAVQIGLRLLYGQIQFQEALFILVITPEFYFPLRLLGQRFHAGMSGISAAKRIFAILDLPKNTPRVDPNLSPSVEIDLEKPFTIRFEGIWVSYSERRENILEDVNFTIQSGEITALVGRSGVGKSTLFNLLLGFIQPQQGNLLLNEAALWRYSPRSLRKQIAWVPQEPYIFNSTIAENIAVGKRGASMADIKRAAISARLSNWIDSLPLGYDTQLGEGGFRASGGEAQRIALARAFCMDAPLLLLDEPTSHLDPLLETDLEQVTRVLMKNRTVLVIAHRLATVAGADHILVFDHGRVVEQGTHTNLRSAGGVYQSLLQAYGGEG